ncbi:MAG: FtsH protease activity modulator HflK [Micavibrio sp.]|nr:FtsH protease activity modulator HflK [Micavibrio sp.]|tara:strand:+ start:303 stop:1397 length:1095 start_codon:yes stop_codon:yes gene_type:complete
MQNDNPWGGSGGGSNNNSGGRRPTGSSTPPNAPDLDELLRQAQARFKNQFPNQGNVIILIALIVLGLWLASGIYRVDPGEYAVIQRFGKHERTQVTEGLGYAFPSPIEKTTIVNVQEFRKLEIGFRDSSTGRRSGAKQKVTEESLMLTSDANIVDLDLVVFWNISNAEDFIFNIKDVEATIKKVAESAIREVVGQTKLQPIITKGRDRVAQRAQAIMQQNLDDYKSGVSIRQVLIQDATVHPEVLPAFEDVVAAIQDAETYQNEATIYANDIIPKARGEAIQKLQQAEAYKASQITKSEGDAKRFTEVYQAYLKGKDVTKERIYIETMEKVLKNAKKTIIDQEQGSSGVVPYLPLKQLKSSKGE